MFSLQVKHIFSKTRSLPSLLRKIVTAPGSGASGTLYRLDRRALVRVQGVGDAAERYEATGFLQGLLTNDVRHIQEGSSCIYAMLLNTKGRVMFDTLVHATDDRDSFLLECDAEVLTDLKKHLRMYRLKRKIDIEDFNDFNLFSFIGQPEKLLESKIKLHRDPRTQSLGCRLFVPQNVSNGDLRKSLGEKISFAHPDDYKYLRYQLGVSEGVEDMPPGACIPLEANCDYLHGVSFHKGCYIGQELVARVHHTGVVRKRFMPLKLEKVPTEPIPKDSPISNSESAKTNIGKLKGVMKDYALVLVNISEALQAKSLEVAGYKAAAVRPDWWPVEASKEKASATKTNT